MGILCDFVRVSLTTLQLVVENKRLLGEWIGLLKSSSKPEMSAAVLHSLAKVVYQEDRLYIGGSGSSAAAPVSVLTGVQNAGSAEAGSSCCNLELMLLTECG